MARGLPHPEMPTPREHPANAAPGFVQDLRQWCVVRAEEFFDNLAGKTKGEEVIQYARMIEAYVTEPTLEK